MIRNNKGQFVKGHSSWNKGKKTSKATKQKLSLILKGNGKGRKMSKAIHTKAFAKKIIGLRLKSILNRKLGEEYPYVTIKKLYIDWCALPKEWNEQYAEVLSMLRKEE